MSAHQITDCRSFLEWQVKAGHHGIAAFVLEHGRSFAADDDTFKGHRMKAKECFANATRRAMRDASLTYVEGYVNTIIPLHHAWLMRSDGGIIDPTLSPIGVDGKPREIGDYFGVPFPTRWLLEFTLKTQTYGVLDGMSRESRDLICGRTPFPFSREENEDEQAGTGSVRAEDGAHGAC